MSDIENAAEQAWGRRLSERKIQAIPEKLYELKIDMREELKRGFRMGVEWQTKREANPNE